MKLLERGRITDETVNTPLRTVGLNPQRKVEETGIKTIMQVMRCSLRPKTF